LTTFIELIETAKDMPIVRNRVITPIDMTKAAAAFTTYIKLAILMHPTDTAISRPLHSQERWALS
jgi:hypothetical protein